MRIGTAEIYRIVEEFAEITEGLVIGQSYDNDVRIVLFVRLAEGATLSDDLIAPQDRYQGKASPRHVPAVIVK